MTSHHHHPPYLTPNPKQQQQQQQLSTEEEMDGHLTDTLGDPYPQHVQLQQPPINAANETNKQINDQSAMTEL